ncbi:MAG TPA: STAS domain-containing protein [Candidatus Limnocylindrales bacterium]|nr:STAS domain-containing protein [Candidatus Limnocylindrales bacterium]
MPAPTRVVAVPARIGRADVRSVVARCLDEASAGGPLSADCSDVADAALPTIDVLARLALAGARERRPFRLEHASPELLDLLALCGLATVLGRERGRR